jgi:hypothetical protein
MSARFVTRMHRGVLLLLPLCLAAMPAAAQKPHSDWSLDPGFQVSVDKEGFSFPSAIAFVPDPGPNPDDPLYFVNELRGKIKVVTNDRSVHTFAEDFVTFVPEKELPDGKGQAGVAGLCLDPVHGYVFATFAYQDDDGILRNNIARFQSKPDTFSVKAEERVEFTDVFDSYDTGLSHFIGNCQVVGNHLYVGVGDGWQPHKAQQLDAMRGKMLRMTLDGDPVPDNPFYVDDDHGKARNYVWAYGLRNPFSLKTVGDRLMVAENGMNIDRFLELQEGLDYFWSGDDRTIASNASAVFIPSIGPVQLDRFDKNKTSNFDDDLDGVFFVATSAVAAPGTGPGIMQIDYDLKTRRVVSAPKYFMRYAPDRPQVVAALAFGPDGLYFAPLFPGESGTSPILKVTYDRAAATGQSMLQLETPNQILFKNGCVGCHTIFGGGGNGGTAAPEINEASLNLLYQRLNSDLYVQSLDALDQTDRQPQAQYADWRADVRKATGWNRVRTWIKYRIQEPRFDILYSNMPNQGVSPEEAKFIADYLVSRVQPGTLYQRLRKMLPGVFHLRHMAYALAGGFVGGAASFAVLAWLILPWLRSRRAR